MQMNVCVWKSQYWSFNPCITSVMHLFCGAHSAASNEKFKMTTPATDALLLPRLEADAGATAQCTRRENDTNEVCDGIIWLRNVLGTFFIDFGLQITQRKEVWNSALRSGECGAHRNELSVIWNQLVSVLESHSYAIVCRTVCDDAPSYWSQTFCLYCLPVFSHMICRRP